MSEGLDTNRSLEELKARAEQALERKDLVEIAAKHSPSASHLVAMKRTKDENLAKACRWLAVIRRDYGEEAFAKFVSNHKKP